MKKVYLAGLLAVGILGANAQQVPMKNNLKESTKELHTVDFNSTNQGKPVNHGVKKVTPFYTNDFGTPADWSIPGPTNGSLDWMIGTDANIGTLAGGFFGAPNFTTKSNGYAIFNGVEQLVNGSVDPIQEATIATANDIDMSAYTLVTLSFSQKYMAFNYDQTFVDYSLDGGTSWTAVEVNATYATNDGPFEEVKYVTFDAMNSSTVRIRFRWFCDASAAADPNSYGSGYGWFVDDIAIAQIADYEVALSDVGYMTDAYNDFGVKTAYSLIPDGQQTPTMFMGTITNNGTLDATNCQLNVEVLDPSSTSVFTGSDNAGMATVAYQGVQGDSVYSFTPSAGVTGAFTFNYSIGYDNVGSDDVTNNNTGTKSFTVGGFYYALDNGASSGYFDIGDSPAAWNVFDIETTTTLTGVSIALGSSTVADLIVYPYILEVDPLAADIGSYPITFDGSGGFDEYLTTSGDLSSGSTINWIDLPINQGAGVTLQAGKAYLIGFGHYAAPGDVVAMLASSTQPDFGSLFYTPSSSPAYSYTTSATTIRANFRTDINVEENNANINLVAVPNPADESTQIQFELKEESNVSVEIIDITGKVVYSNNFGTLSTGVQKINIDVNNFASGMYTYNVKGDNFTATDKLIVRK